ncbi:MAG: lysylphosphatidylglycerol synthase domain-containing protein [Aeromicrobium sp.]
MDATPVGPAPTGSKRTSARSWARRAALLVMLALAAVAITRNYQAIAEDLERIPPWTVAAAAVFAVLGMLASLQVWRELIAGLGSPLGLKISAHIFFVSQLGKYVPGSLWSIVAQMEMGREHRVPRRSAAVLGVLALVISGVAGVTVAVALMPWVSSDLRHRFWWLALVLPLLYVAIHPRLLDRVLNRLLRLARREPLPAAIGWSSLLKATAWQCLTWLLLGLQVWFIAIGLDGDPVETLAPSIVGYALAYTLGMAAFFLPAGAGVRDAVLVLALAGSMPTSSALVVALIVRCLATLVDLLLAGIQLVIHRVTA